MRTTTKTITITVGPELFSFTSEENWVRTAQCKFNAAGVAGTDVLCIDAKGRVCEIGLQFKRATSDGAYPIKVYEKIIEENSND